jgi:hypothetical protein
LRPKPHPSSLIGIKFAVDVVTGVFIELPCIDVQLHFYSISDPLEIFNY